MIGVLNTAYYGIPTGRKCSATWDSDVKAGDLVNETIWHLYRTEDNQPIAGHWGLPFDDSVYLWKLPPVATYACNSAFCISRGNTLNVEVVTNVPETNAPLGLACMDKQSAVSAFIADPAERLAYDDTKAGGGAQTSSIFYNIPYSHYCIYGRAAVYDKSNNTLQGTTLVTSGTYACRNWINADEDNRDVAIILPALYFGDNDDRRAAEGYQDGSSLIGAIVPDILTDRPIPSNADYVKAAIQDHHDDWITDKVFSPFNQVLRANWSDSTTTSQSNQLMIGVFQQYTYSQLRSGAQYYKNLTDKITGQFFRFNTAVKNFDDVVYKWDLKFYDITSQQFIDNGTDITNRSGNFKILTVLNILDKKGNSKGVASELAVKHELAYLGFYFAETEEKAKTDNLLNGDGVYLPEIIDGVTTGNYYTGEDIASIPYADAEDVGAFKYNADAFDDEGMRPTIINTGTISCGVTYYGLTEDEMKDLTVWLNTTYAPNDYDEFIVDFKGTNPADYLTTVMYYPFDIPYHDTSTPITIGKLATGTTGAKLNYEYGKLFNYGTYHIPAFNDFRDYLTKISVFVPFCGTVDLDPRLWVGCDLTVKMAIDWPTGVCTAQLYRDGVMIDTISGTIGVPLPLSSFANGSYQVAITNMLASHKAAHRQMITGSLGAAGGAAAAVGGALSGNYAALVAGLLGAGTSALSVTGAADKMDNLDYNIDHTQPTISQVSGGSPFINCGSDYSVIILRTLPQLPDDFDSATYARNTGYADCRPVSNLKNETGLTVVTNIDTDGLSVPLDLVAELTKACKEGLIL